MRYRDPISNEITEKSQHTKNGKYIVHQCEYFMKEINKWVKKDYVPQVREATRKRHSTERGFFLRMKVKMKERNKLWKKQGKIVIGENEFEEGKGKCSKLMAAFSEQVKMYGNRCPITLIEFTTIRNNEIVGRGGAGTIFSNISSDRLLSHINYTKQNLLFTAWGWNWAKGEWRVKDLRHFVQPDVIERYRKILVGRFPDQKYET